MSGLLNKEKKLTELINPGTAPPARLYTYRVKFILVSEYQPVGNLSEDELRHNDYKLYILVKNTACHLTFRNIHKNVLNCDDAHIQIRQNISRFPGINSNNEVFTV